MDTDRTIGHHFLVVLDYGQGSAWAFIAAKSASEIHERFPALQVYESRPDDISPQRFEEMKAESAVHFGSIDDPDFWILRAAALDDGTQP